MTTREKPIERQEFTSKEKESIYTTEIILPVGIHQGLINTIRNLKDRGEGVPYGSSNVKAFMTDWIMQHDPGFDKLGYEIIQRVEHISKGKRGNNPIALANMWGLLYCEGESAKFHTHWPSTWSGVFYLEIPTDYSGALVFPDLEHYIEPVKNKLVVFEGDVLHGVNSLKSTQERIAISFNFGTAD